MRLYPGEASEGTPAAEASGVMSEINTTPLVDVMLVLLIIFLITIPAVSASVQVSLPVERSQMQQATPETVVISVDKSGAIYWNREGPVVAEMLAAGFQSIATMNPQPEVHVRGDAALPYSVVHQVMANAQAAGVLRVGLLTEPGANP
jgi:biopolymer transport protein ExbD